MALEHRSFISMLLDILDALPFPTTSFRHKEQLLEMDLPRR